LIDKVLKIIDESAKYDALGFIKLKAWLRGPKNVVGKFISR
jgi:hypothetical protein